MRKIILILIILLSFSFVYAEDLVDQYIEMVENGQFSEAELDIFKSEFDHKALEMFLTAHGALLEYDYKMAYESLEMALTEENLEPRLESEILYYLAMIDLEMYNDYLAITRAMVLKELAHDTNDLIGVIRADTILALGYLETYDLVEADKYSSEALNLSKSIGYNMGVYAQYNVRSDIEVEKGNYESAKLYVDKAFEYAKNVEIHDVFYDSIKDYELSKAHILYMQNRNLMAVEALQEYLVSVPEENVFLRTRVQRNMGAYSASQFLRAIGYLEAAKESYYDIGWDDISPLLISDIMDRLAFSYYRAGDYKKAADAYYKASSFSTEGAFGDDETNRFEILGKYKYDEVSENMKLLEELAASKSAELEAQRNLLLIVVSGVVVLVVLGLIIVFVLRSRKASQEALKIHKITDSLTEVYNRTRILEIFESKLQGDNAVVLLDLDNLKEINDIYGYSVGDDVLKAVAESLKQSIRGEDIIGRYGGGEFLVILEHASQEECRIVGERIRSNIENIPWSQTDLQTTCSVGVTRVYSQDPVEVLQYVDTLLDQAKINGKNQVVYG